METGGFISDQLCCPLIFYSFASVFFIDGTSKQSIKHGLLRHVRSLGGAHSQKSFEESMRFLSLPTQDGQRLLVIDNVDDPELPLVDFLPRWKVGL